MRKLTSLGRAGAFFRKVGTLSDMLHFTIEAFGAIPENCKVATDTMPLTHTDVRKRAVVAGAPSIVCKVHTERRAFGDWIVGKVACFSGAGTIAMQKVPADCDLVGIMLIHASQPTTAGA